LAALGPSGFSDGAKDTNPANLAIIIAAPPSNIQEESLLLLIAVIGPRLCPSNRFQTAFAGTIVSNDFIRSAPSVAREIDC
jgi:hypothetical protein